MSHRPTVSVVMPAYNSAKWIAEAIDSILSQTLRDLELIVVDDGSTDCTAEIVSSIQDARIKLIRLGQNSGSAVARNHAIDAALGEFVAQMDADDIALPHRLETQVGFLRRNPSCVVCGGWLETFGEREGVWTTYEAHDHIKADLLFRCGMNHNTVLFRREEIRNLGIRYNADFLVSQDYDLWTRCIDHVKFANIPGVLVRYRLHSCNMSFSKKDKVLAASRTIRARQLAKIGIIPTDDEIELHEKLGEYGPSGPRLQEFDVDMLEEWLSKIISANRKSNYLSKNSLDVLIYEYWRRCCKYKSKFFKSQVLRFFRSNITDAVDIRKKSIDGLKILLNRPLYSLRRSS